MSEIEYMKECMARDLVVMLVDEQKMSLHGALDALYQSETYAKLKDTRSGPVSYTHLTLPTILLV